MRHEVVKIALRMTYLELSADNTFMDEYTSALFMPHTDLDSFPTVKALLAAMGRKGRHAGVGGVGAAKRGSAP